MIKPRQQVPELQLDLINGTKWNLEAQQNDAFTLLVFYRGLHCPKCKKQLEALAKKLDDFSDRGVHLIAISCDTEKVAKQTAQEWDIPELPVGFELSIKKAREWGLFISKGISEEEPDQCSNQVSFWCAPIEPCMHRQYRPCLLRDQNSTIYWPPSILSKKRSIRLGVRPNQFYRQQYRQN